MQLELITREDLNQACETLLVSIKKLLEVSGKAGDFKKLYTNTEACRFLKVCSKTLQNYRDNGLLKFSQVGRKIYYSQEDMEAFITAYKKDTFTNTIKHKIYINNN